MSSLQNEGILNNDKLKAIARESLNLSPITFRTPLILLKLKAFMKYRKRQTL